MQYTQLATQTSLKKTVSALEGHGYTVITTKNKKSALEKVKELIPADASVMNGASVTLEQIGYQDYLAEGKHDWTDWHAKINAEDDQEKRAELRRQSVLSDFYIGSVHALTETGEFVVVSNTASQLPHIVSTSPNLIFVVSTKKIVPTVDEALKRVEKHIIPLEDEHMMDLYNVGTAWHKTLIFHGESSFSSRKITFVLVEEDLGF